MVYLHFPSQFTEEEEMLQKKYQKMKRKRKALQQLKAPKQEPPPNQNPLKRSTEAKQDAKEVAKKLLKSGAISAIKVEPKERQGFKRPKALERKRIGSEKLGGGTVTGYHPFSASHPSDEEHSDGGLGGGSGGGGSGGGGISNSGSRPAIKSLYESFVSAREMEEREKDDRELERTERDRDGRQDRPRQGNTVYVHGFGVTEEILRNGFAPFGNIINISMEMDKNCGFVTFEKIESAEKAISEMNSRLVSGVQLRVSLARRQPLIPPSSDGTVTSPWVTIAASFSQKGAHKDKRDIVTYSEDYF